MEESLDSLLRRLDPVRSFLDSIDGFSLVVTAMSFLRYPVFVVCFVIANLHYEQMAGFFGVSGDYLPLFRLVSFFGKN